jgi:uncharacterized protein (TIGR02145 family)
MNRKISVVGVLAVLSVFLSSASVWASADGGTFTDSRDGQTYRTVTIGSQRWMAQNLNHAGGNSWCYDGDNANCERYGRLYDWNTAMTACPAGWRLPASSDWHGLIMFAGEDGAAAKLKSRSGWNGTDSYGFSALPGGNRGIDGTFREVGEVGRWWTSTHRGSLDDDRAYSWSMASRFENAGDDHNDRREGLSVRCIRDVGQTNGQTDGQTGNQTGGQTGDEIDSATVYYTRALLVGALGEHDRSIELFTRAIEINPNMDEAYADRGSIYLAKGEHNRAVADFTRAISLNPNSAMAFNNRAHAFYTAGDHRRAMADFNDAIRIFPDLASAYLGRGFLYLKQSDYDLAITDFERVLQIEPEHSQRSDIILGINLARERQRNFKFFTVFLIAMACNVVLIAVFVKVKKSLLKRKTAREHGEDDENLDLLEPVRDIWGIRSKAIIITFALTFLWGLLSVILYDAIADVVCIALLGLTPTMMAVTYQTIAGHFIKKRREADKLRKL